MKKIIVLLMAICLGVSVLGCTSNSINSESIPIVTEPMKTEAQVVEPTVWVDIYSGSVLTLNEDGTMTLGVMTGTWDKSDGCLILTYKDADGGEWETYFDTIEENGVSALSRRQSAKLNGEQVNTTHTLYYPQEKASEIRESLVKLPGATVSTDIIEFTLYNAQLSFFAQGVRHHGTTLEVLNPEEACAPSDQDGYYHASKGRTLLCLDFIIKNTDRGKLDTDDNIVYFTVIQNDNYAILRSYDLNNKDGDYGMDLVLCPVSVNWGMLRANFTKNIIIDPQDELRIKMVGVVGFEAVDLTAPFTLVVSVANSNDIMEQFIYEINR